MKCLFLHLLIIVLCYTNCVPQHTANPGIVTVNSNSPSEDQISVNLSLREIETVCKRLENFRNKLDGIMDPRVSDETLLEKELGGYGYIDLLYIVKRYGQEIRIDQVYENCVKYLYIFNDGEYAGLIDEVLPYSTKFRGRSQEWLVNS